MELLEVRLVKVTSTRVTLRNGQVVELSNNSELGIGARAFNGAWGFSSANDRERFEKAIETAVKIARLSRGSSRIHLGDPVSADVELKQRIPLEDVDVADKLSLLREIEALLRDRGVVETAVHYRDYLVETTYTNSLGSEVRTLVPRVYLTLSVTVGGAGKQVFWKGFGGTLGWELVEGIDFVRWTAHVRERAFELLKASPPPSGEMDVIVDPELTGVFVHEALGHAVEADLVRRGESVLAGKLGERIAAADLNVVDDPTLPGKFGSYPYDDEGVEARRVEIIKDGVLLNYLNDRETSGHFDLEPNGHARAESYSHQPLVRMSNTYVEPGDYSFDEILEGFNGLYLLGDRGGEVDTTNGTFTFGAKLGYVVERGEIKEPVRDVALSGKILDVLRNVRAIGNDTRVEFPGHCWKGQWVPVDGGGPHILTRALVGGLR